MAENKSQGLRFTLGPEATELALLKGNLSQSKSLEISILELKEQADSAEERVGQAEGRALNAEQRTVDAEEEASRYRVQNEKLANGFDALRDLADATIYRNKISVEVAKVFEKHFEALHKTQLHTCGLIGLNAVDDEERELLIKQMTRNITQLRSDLGGRSDRAREESRENVETTQKIVREVNDTRAAVQSTQSQELDLVVGEDRGIER